VYLATSLAALELALKTATGESPSIAPDTRLGWMPEGGVASTGPSKLDSFSSGSWKEALATTRNGMKLIGILGAFLPELGETGLLKPLFKSLPRLDGAVRALGFLGERRSYTRRQGGTLRGTGTTKLFEVRKI